VILNKGARIVVEAIVIIVALIISLVPFTFIKPLLELANPYQGIASSARQGLLNGLRINAKGIPGSAEVIWDPNGIPHIYATTDDVAIYSLGWVEASQRLFQMDLIRRLIEGNLSALLGKRALNEDKFIIMLGLPEIIEKTSYDIVNNKRFSLLTHYINLFVKGVNDYIRYAISHDLLPPEYKILGLRPEVWRFKDVVALEKFFSLMLSYDDTDLILQTLVSRWGPEILLLMDIINRSRNLAVASCNTSETWGSVLSNMLNSNNRYENLSRVPNPRPLTKLFESFVLSLKNLGIDLNEVASNDWVISGLFTKSGRPIVANDPHLSLTAPSLWMLVHISAPNLNVAGVLLPGSPFVIIGRNEHIAWGFTDLLGDFVDYYYYVWNGSKYYYKGRWLEPIKKNVTLIVWDPVKRRYTKEIISVERTVHGPLLEFNGTKYAVKWTGLYESNELEFIMELNFAKNVKEALYAQRYFGSPIQNFVVADDEGNFAWSPLGYYPIRTNLPIISLDNITIVNYGFLPFNGSRGEGEWRGFVKLKGLPILYNPKLPFIATANTKPWKGSCGFYIGYEFADRFRLERIQDLLYSLISRPKRINVHDIMKVQLDIMDLSIKDYLRLLLELIERGGYKLLNGKELNIIKELSLWNGSMQRNLWQPTVASAWIYEFHSSLWRYLYGDSSNLYSFRIEYAESLMLNYINGNRLAYKVTSKGFLERLAATSLRKALDILSKYYKTDDYRKWIYEKVHYYDPRHPLGTLFPGFNYPKLPAPGGPYTINVAPPFNFSANEGMPVTHGPSVRLISDLGNELLYVSLPGGNSGNPFSPYYYNLYPKWAEGMYIAINLSKAPSEINAISRFWVNR
jgi:penicillin amidase